MNAWYEQSFGADYLIVYKHRNLEHAYKEVKRMTEWLSLPERAEILDLCCGMGRHAMALAELGYKVTGLDLSDALLSEARKLDKHHEIEWLQGDMRSIPLQKTFDAVVNLFTSFGYFSTDAENEQVLHEIDRVLKPGGQYIIDFLNASYVKKHLVPHSERQIDGITIEETRTIEHELVQQSVRETVVKQIVMKEEGRADRHYEERVRLYELADFEAMLARTQLHIDHVYGDYDQSSHNSDSSPRLIIVGHKLENKSEHKKGSAK